ncbi:MAG: hypothetical protein ACJ74U_20230 [Jatrophihabitantaceae bacterium]
MAAAGRALGTTYGKAVFAKARFGKLRFGKPRFGKLRFGKLRFGKRGYDEADAFPRCGLLDTASARSVAAPATPQAT